VIPLPSTICTHTEQLENPPLPGQVQPDTRGFIRLQNKFGEETRFSSSPHRSLLVGGIFWCSSY